MAQSKSNGLGYIQYKPSVTIVTVSVAERSPVKTVANEILRLRSE